MNEIEVQHLTKTYPTFTLDDVTFVVPRGQVTGFIGRNGAGKSTTLKAILSLIHYEGSVTFHSADPHKPFTNQNIGVITGDPFLAPDWTMKEVNSAMKLGYITWDEKLFWDRLSRFNINPSLKVKGLSRGMTIKLMLSIALSHHAELLVLDEPTSGLDPGMRDEFVTIIATYMEEDGHTVLFSTHITQDLEEIADNIVFINAGRVVLSATKDDFLQYYRILKGPSDSR